MKLLDTKKKNEVLGSMIDILDRERESIIAANKKDLDLFDPNDRAMYDRLVVDNKKVDGMIQAVKEVQAMADPVGKQRSEVHLENGLDIIDRTAPFGTILIIYESRPDVTIEAAVLAFKANNKILLKGGKEAVNSNKKLEECWHEALESNGLDKSWIKLLTMDRKATQALLREPTEQIDLIVPRGGERLIAFVKEHATCPVLISGRGNNFVYVHADADRKQSIDVIVNAKTHKISACNALDKILVDKNMPDLEGFLKELDSTLKQHDVKLMADKAVKAVLTDAELIEDEAVWYEEFLALKACIALSDGLDDAIDWINKYSGGHSNTIMTTDKGAAMRFMEQVDSAAVYHNASTRFTDGGQMGVGAELAISTDKLHHRGPLGLDQLVTNKYYVFGDGQVRV